MAATKQPSLSEWPVAPAGKLASKAPWRRISWFTFVMAIFCQSVVAREGTIAAVIYVGAVGMFVAAYPRNAARAALADVLPWLHPILAMASILWSDAASTSLRLAIELCFTTAAMLAVGRRLSTREIISGLLVAMLMCGLISFAMDARSLFTGSHVPLIGMYASKNQLAFHMVLLVLCCVAVLLDGTQPALVRLAAVPALILGLLLTHRAQSAGATVMGALAVMVLLGIVFIGSMPRRLHARLIASGVIVFVGIAVLVLSSGHELAEAFFTATGKDAGLTGRTFLWQRATQLIAERPTLGYGYQAFWRQNYPEAEALWRYFHIADRSGFHFHDLYYEVTIELGLAGLATVLYTLGAYAIRAVCQAMVKPGPQTGFLLALCVFLLARSGIEVDITYPLGTVATLFPILLTRSIVAAKPSAETIRRPVANGTSMGYLPWGDLWTGVPR